MDFPLKKSLFYILQTEVAPAEAAGGGTAGEGGAGQTHSLFSGCCRRKWQRSRGHLHSLMTDLRPESKRREAADKPGWMLGLQSSLIMSATKTLIRASVWVRLHFQKLPWCCRKKRNHVFGMVTHITFIRLKIKQTKKNISYEIFCVKSTPLGDNNPFKTYPLKNNLYWKKKCRSKIKQHFHWNIRSVPQKAVLWLHFSFSLLRLWFGPCGDKRPLNWAPPTATHLSLPAPRYVFDGLMLLSRPPSSLPLQRREVTVSVKLHCA